MVQGILIPITFFAALGSGVIAGLLFAFSSFVMTALGRLPPAQGISAMQSINIAILTPSFLFLFLGTAVASIVVAISALFAWGKPDAFHLLLGGGLFCLGVIGVTMGFNVPLNNALAAVEPTSTEAAALWTRYLSTWTVWNHVRTAAALGATASFILALRVSTRAAAA